MPLRPCCLVPGEACKPVSWCNRAFAEQEGTQDICANVPLISYFVSTDMPVGQIAQMIAGWVPVCRIIQVNQGAMLQSQIVQVRVYYDLPA